MANQATATISIGADVSKLEASIRASLSKLEQNAKFSPTLNSRNFALGQITGQVNDFNRSLDAANKRVLAFGANAIVIGSVLKIFKELTVATIDVDRHLTQINAVFGLSSRGLKDFSASLFSVAKNTSQSFDSVAKAAEDFARQGLSAVETLKRVNGAMTLTRQSGLEVSKSVDSITAALNGFAKENLNVEQVVNKLIAVDTKFAVSSADLAEAISRVGSTAADAGVSFDTLIGLVTSAQQITARGGAVIGNALKTIFTRLGRSETIDQLESLGIAVKDLQNNILPASTILKNLAVNFDDLTQSQKQAVTQLTAGTFQVNQLRAILTDLGKSYSVVSQAQNASASATNEAAKRNDVLNKSLSSLLQNTKTTFTEIGSVIGEQTFAGPLKIALGAISDNFIVDALKNSVSDESGKTLGGKIASGMLSGISNILTGPGFITILSVFGSLASRLVKDSVQSFGTLIGGRETELKTVNAISQTLSQASEIDKQRFTTASSIAQKEQVILEILAQQNAMRAAQASSFVGLAAGISSGGGKALRNPPSFASGYMPIHEEMNAISHGVGGASSSARPVILDNFNFGGGRSGTVVANSSEYVVPNFANGGSAIFNQNMISKFGLPNGATKIAAGGYIPNAADGLFSGGDKLRSSINGQFANGEQLQMINLLFDKYKAAVIADVDVAQQSSIKAIKHMKLTDASKESILIAFELEKKAIIATQQAVEKQAIEQQKALEVMRKANSVNDVEQQKIRQRKADAATVPIYGLTPRTKPTADQIAVSQISEEASFPAVDPRMFIKGQNASTVATLTSFGRNQKFNELVSKNNSGEQLDTQSSKFLTEELRKQGQKLAEKTFEPGSSSKVIKSFVSDYVTSQLTQLDNAFGSAVNFKQQGSIFKQLQERVVGYKKYFGSLDGDIEDIVKKNKLSPQAEDNLRNQATAIQGQRSSRLQSAALVSSFALPMIAGFIPQGPGGKTGSQVSGAFSGALQGAGSGLAAGGLFGPAGAAIGGGIGLVGGGLFGWINKASKSFEELSQTISDLNAKNAEQIQSVSSYIQIQQKLNDAIERGAPSKQINGLLGEQRTSLSKVTNLGDRKSILDAGGDINKLAEVLGEINLKASKQSSANDVVSSLGSARNKAGMFSGLNGKDIEDAANALVVATDTSDEKIRKSFDKLRSTFQKDPLSALGDLEKNLGINDELIKDSVKSFKNHPDQLKLILSRYIDIFDSSAKDLQKVQENARKNSYNINFSKLLRREGETNIAGAELFQSNSLSANRISNAGSNAALNIVGGNSLEKLRQENQLTIQNAIREANIQSQAATRRSLGKVQEVASNDKTIGGDLASQLANLSTPKDFKDLATKLGYDNEAIVKVLNESYNELTSLNNNSANSISELKEISRLGEIRARFEERNKVLSGSVYNAGNLNTFSQSRITGKTGQFAQGGAANQFNALNAQISFADQLGLGETSDTQKLRDSVRSGSAKINFVEILSTILGKEITDNKEDIDRAIEEVLKRPISSINDALDADTVKRIKSGIDVSGFDTSSALSEIGKGGKNLNKFISSGKVSLGEGALIAPLSSIDSKLGSEGPIAKLLSEIVQNRILAGENKKNSEDDLKITDLDKKISNAQTNYENFRISTLSHEDLRAGLLKRNAPGLSGVIDYTQEQRLKGKSPSEIFQDVTTNRDLLNRSGASADQVKKSFFDIADEKFINSGGMERDTAQSRMEASIKKLQDSRSQLQSIINVARSGRAPSSGRSSGDTSLIDNFDLGEDLKVGAFSSGQRGRSGKIKKDNSFYNPITLKEQSNLRGQLDQNKDDRSKVETAIKAAEKVNASYQDRIDLLKQLNDLETKNALLNNSALGTFTGGFKSKMLDIRKSMKDLQDVGATVGASLESNLGNSFGDFVTGAKKGKDAFNQFIVSVLNDSARAFASKAMQGVIGSIAGSFMGKSAGGPITALASGGQVPALVMGGEYYFEPEQVKNIENRYGKGFVQKINSGQAPMYAKGGPISGGSGTKDDIFAHLDVGGYVINKNSVNKYGVGAIDAIANGGEPQHKFIGGFLIGSLIGAGVGYATSSKKNRGKNALIGAGIGGIVGGLAQNYSQTGNAFQSGSNSGLFSFGSNSSAGSTALTAAQKSNLASMGLDSDAVVNGASKSSSSLFGAGTSSAAKLTTAEMLKQSLAQAGVAGALGLGTSYFSKKSSSTDTYVSPYAGMPTGSQVEIDKQRANGQFAYLNQNGNINYYGRAPATRKFANGGPISGGSGSYDDIFTHLSAGGAVINRGAASKYGNAGLQRFASGGYVGGNVNTPANIGKAPNSEPSVYIKIDINNNGEASTSTKDDSNGKLSPEFAQKLSTMVRNITKDEIIQQSRNGGIAKQLSRTNS